MDGWKDREAGSIGWALVPCGRRDEAMGGREAHRPLRQTITGTLPAAPPGILQLLYDIGGAETWVAVIFILTATPRSTGLSLPSQRASRFNYDTKGQELRVGNNRTELLCRRAAASQAPRRRHSHIRLTAAAPQYCVAPVQPRPQSVRSQPR